VFVTVITPFYPSLVFEGKAVAYPSLATYLAPLLALPTNIRLG
jgi:hypothetical protein